MNQTENNKKLIEPINQSTLPYYYQDDEITLKEFLLKTQEFWREIYKNKWLLILIMAIVASVFLAITWMQKVTYTANLSFMLTEESSNRGGTTTELLGLGVVDYNLDKISALATSSKIIYEALLQKVILNEKEDFIANHLIDIYDLHENWKNEGGGKYEAFALKDFYFMDGIEDYNRKEQRALKILQDLIVKKLLTISYDKRTQVFLLNSTTLNESLSTNLVDNIYESLVDFYVDKTVGRPQKIYKMLALRTDSLSQLLEQKEQQLALSKDRTSGLIGSTYQVTIGKLSRQVAQIDARYMQALKNREGVEYILQNKTPDFQIINRTFIPLRNAASKLNALIIGGALGLFLGIAYVVMRKIIRDALV